MSISNIRHNHLAFGAKKVDASEQKGLRNEAWVKCYNNFGEAKAVRASSIGTIKEGLAWTEDKVRDHWGIPYSLLDREDKLLGHIRLKAFGLRTMEKEPTPSEGVEIIANKINSSKPGQVIDLTA